MALKNEVEAFLASFHEKIEIFGILFRDDREKNRMALIDLDISRLERLGVIKGMKTIPKAPSLTSSIWVQKCGCSERMSTVSRCI